MAFELRRLWIWLFPKGEAAKQEIDESVGDSARSIVDAASGREVKARLACARRGHPLFQGQRDTDCFDCHIIDRMALEWEVAKETPPDAELAGALFCLKGLQKGQTYPLLLVEDIPLNIGADPDADIVLRDKTISRRHVMVLRRQARIVLRDLGSLHHSAIRSEGELQWQVLDPKRDYWFRDGTHLLVGGVEFLYRSIDEQGLRVFRLESGSGVHALAGGGA